MFSYKWIIAVFMLCTSCFDQVETQPPCFLDGSEESETVNEVGVNVCCEPGSIGNDFCRDFFKEEGYGSISQLAQCTEQSYCQLCEIGQNCACLSNRDCGATEQCTISESQESCKDTFGSGFQSQRCIMCIERD